MEWIELRLLEADDDKLRVRVSTEQDACFAGDTAQSSGTVAWPVTGRPP
jgi:hypothetical protein